MAMTRPVSVLLGVLVALLAVPRASPGFSVLAHQAVVDSAWEDSIVPALRRRFPEAGADALRGARAYAYGGSHIPDLGYFPLGNRLFTDLTHYVRSGDFITALVESAGTLDEYAFALGALSHHITDSIGHPEATNPTVAEVYPELRKKYGDSVTYAEDHSAHLRTEFRFDVFQAARSADHLDLVQHAVAFEVSKPVLDRAFEKTYGLRLDDLFVNTDVAIATYRWAFREVIHEVTGIAWELYEADIRAVDPNIKPDEFIQDMSRADFQKEFGKTFREPGYLAKFLALLVKLVPDVGPFKRMPYKPLPAEAQQRFQSALSHILAEYRSSVAEARRHSPARPNLNLDTGRPVHRGEYEPADAAYASLLEKLEDRHFDHVPRALRADILRFYGASGDEAAAVDDDRGKLGSALAQLAAVRGER